MKIGITGKVSNFVPGSDNPLFMDALKQYINEVCSICSKLCGDVIYYGRGPFRSIPKIYSREYAKQYIKNILKLMSDIIDKNIYPFKNRIESLNIRKFNSINSIDEVSSAIGKGYS